MRLIARCSGRRGIAVKARHIRTPHALDWVLKSPPTSTFAIDCNAIERTAPFTPVPGLKLLSRLPSALRGR